MVWYDLILRFCFTARFLTHASMELCACIRPRIYPCIFMRINVIYYGSMFFLVLSAVYFGKHLGSRTIELKVFSSLKDLVMLGHDNMSVYDIRLHMLLTFQGDYNSSMLKFVLLEIHYYKLLCCSLCIFWSTSSVTLTYINLLCQFWLLV